MDVPIANSGVAITSAEMPDFQAKPIAVVTPAENEGRAAGA